MVLLELVTGMRRLGVLPGAAAVELAERVAALDGIELAALFTHGHVYVTVAESGRAVGRWPVAARGLVQ